jgi:hypothetical protein
MLIYTLADVIGLSLLALFVLAFAVAYAVERIKIFWSKKK